MSLVAFTGRGRLKGTINHFEFIVCPHLREPVVNGLTCSISTCQSKYPLGHIQQFGVLGTENRGQPEVTQIHFGKSKG